MKHLLKGKNLVILADQGLVSGMNFLLTIVLVAILGLDEFGTVALILLGVQISLSIQNAFITQTMYTLYCSSNTQKQFLRLQHAMNLILSGLLGGLTALVFSSLISSQFLVPVWLLVTGFLIHDFNRRVAFTLNNPSNALKRDAVMVAVQAILLGIGWGIRGIGTTEIVLLLGVGYLLPNIKSMVLTACDTKQVPKSILILQVKANWKYSRYLIATAFLQWFTGNAFTVIAGVAIGVKAIGIIRMLQNIMGVLHILFLAFENIVPIQMARKLNELGAAGLKKETLKWTKAGLFPTLILIIVLCLFSNTIIEFLYGAEQVQYGYLLTALSLMYLLVYVGTILRFYVRTIEQNQVIFHSYILSSVFSILLGIPIVSMYGITGVIIGFYISQIVTIFYFIYKLKLH